MLFWKSRSNPGVRCGAIVDIGSGSVAAALVVVNDITKESSIVWTHREHVLLRTTASIQNTEHAVRTALVNVFLELGSIGLRTLNEHAPGQGVTDVHVSLAAPWHITVAKQVNFSDNKPFQVDATLISDLTKLAAEQAQKKASESGLLSQFGLSVIAERNVGVRVNGYLTKNYEHAHTTELSFTHLTSLSTTGLMESIEELCQKIVPKAKVTTEPFMFAYFETVHELHSNTLEACLIDITNEATEVALIRDGSLSFVHHTPIGSFTLARQIAEALNVPAEEAFTYLKAGSAETISSLPQKRQDAINEVFASYSNALQSLFKDTGDSLSIPQSLYVHTDLKTEDFFYERLSEAAKAVTASTHSIHPVTSELVSDSHSGDTAILLGIRHYIGSED